jgi:alkylhydroperoxidase family enzyme
MTTQVARINMCTFGMDASRWHVLTKDPGNLERLDALPHYRTSPLFSEAQRAALDSASELTAALTSGIVVLSVSAVPGGNDHAVAEPAQDRRPAEDGSRNATEELIMR